MEASTKHWISLICLIMTTIFICVGYAGADGKVAWSAYKCTAKDQYKTCYNDKTESLGLLQSTSKYDSDKCSASWKGKELNIRYDSKGNYDASDPDKYYCQPETKDDSDTGKARREACDTCNGVGKTIISFLTFGAIAGVAGIAAVWMKKTNPNAGGMVGVASWAAPAACAFCLMLCWTTWNGCNAEMVANNEETNKASIKAANVDLDPDEISVVELSAGYAMAFVGMVLSIVSAILQFMTKSDSA